MAIGGETVGRLTFALYGKAAPTITGNFLKVLDGKAQGASYDFSSIWRVQKASCCFFWGGSRFGLFWLLLGMLVGWLCMYVGGKRWCWGGKAVAPVQSTHQLTPRPHGIDRAGHLH